MRGIFAARVLQTRHQRAWNMTTTTASGAAEAQAAAKAASRAERPTMSGAMSDIEPWSDGSKGAGGVATELRSETRRVTEEERGRAGHCGDEVRVRVDVGSGVGEVKAAVGDMRRRLFVVVGEGGGEGEDVGEDSGGSRRDASSSDGGPEKLVVEEDGWAGGDSCLKLMIGSLPSTATCARS